MTMALHNGSLSASGAIPRGTSTPLDQLFLQFTCQLQYRPPFLLRQYLTFRTISRPLTAEFGRLCARGAHTKMVLFW